MGARSRLIVVGGGISGLAAAQAATEVGGERVEVLLLERDAEVGGKATSIAKDGWRAELGPTGYLDNEPAMDDLVRAAGLEKLPANEAAARRFLVREGRLNEIHAHPLRFLKSGVLSLPGLLRLCAEPFVPQRRSEDDETIWDFARRRLGKQAADRLIAPMVLGVFAGEARALSLRSCFPRMAELEERYGSLVKAMRKLKREKRASGGPAGPAGKLTSFAHGLEELPRALARNAGFEVHTGAEVASLRQEPRTGTWIVRLADGRSELVADGVVLAAEVYSAADMLREDAPELARELDAIPSPEVSVVALGYGPTDLPRVPHGFGALVQRGGPQRILGVLWDTHLFPNRSPDGHLLVRAMLGGAVDPDAAGLSEEELAAVARADLAALFGIRSTPVFQHVRRWPRAIPQYAVGHPTRVRRIEALVRARNDRAGHLALAGNYLSGISFAKAGTRGLAAGREAVHHLLAPRGASTAS